MMNHKFSGDIKALLVRLCDRPLTLGEILACTAERGFGLLITTGIGAMGYALWRSPGWLGQVLPQFSS